MTVQYLHDRLETRADIGRETTDHSADNITLVIHTHAQCSMARGRSQIINAHFINLEWSVPLTNTNCQS